MKSKQKAVDKEFQTQLIKSFLLLSLYCYIYIIITIIIVVVVVVVFYSHYGNRVYRITYAVFFFNFLYKSCQIDSKAANAVQKPGDIPRMSQMSH